MAALAGSDVLDADVDALLHHAVADALVDDDAEGARGNVEDDTGAAVVEAVGHAALFSRVCHDVDVIANAVDVHVGGKADLAMFAEVAAEEVAGASSVAKGVRHLSKGLKSPWLGPFLKP